MKKDLETLKNIYSIFVLNEMNLSDDEFSKTKEIADIIIKVMSDSSEENFRENVLNALKERGVEYTDEWRKPLISAVNHVYDMWATPELKKMISDAQILDGVIEYTDGEKMGVPKDEKIWDDYKDMPPPGGPEDFYDVDDDYDYYKDY